MAVKWTKIIRFCEGCARGIGWTIMYGMAGLVFIAIGFTKYLPIFAAPQNTNPYKFQSKMTIETLKSERGVALLMTLSVLSLTLILGIAFIYSTLNAERSVQISKNAIYRYIYSSYGLHLTQYLETKRKRPRKRRKKSKRSLILTDFSKKSIKMIWIPCAIS